MVCQLLGLQDVAERSHPQTHASDLDASLILPKRLKPASRDLKREVDARVFRARTHASYGSDNSAEQVRILVHGLAALLEGISELLEDGDGPAQDDRVAGIRRSQSRVRMTQPTSFAYRSTPKAPTTT